MRISLKVPEGIIRRPKMTPAQPEAQVPYRTRAWFAVTGGTTNTQRDQSRAACTPEKMRPINRRPSGPTSLGHPTGLLPGAMAHTWGAIHNRASGLRARAKGFP